MTYDAPILSWMILIPTVMNICKYVEKGHEISHIFFFGGLARGDKVANKDLPQTSSFLMRKRTTMHH